MDYWDHAAAPASTVEGAGTLLATNGTLWKDKVWNGSSGYAAMATSDGGGGSVSRWVLRSGGDGGARFFTWRIIAHDRCT